MVLARDSARYFERTLPNIRGVADELVIGVDSLSRDDSAEVAKRFADRVIHFPHASILPGASGAGTGVDDLLLPQCSGDWILRVDHDETLGPEWLDQGLLESILSDRRMTHAFVPRRWVVADGESYLSGRHWHPDGSKRLLRNIPSLIRMPSEWHQEIRCAGEASYLAELYIVHWSNLWTTRAERVARSCYYANQGTYSSHEFYLYEHQPYALRPLFEPLPDPRFDVEYPATADPRFRVSLRVLRAPETILAGDMEPVLIGIHNGSERPLRPDSDLVQTRGLSLTCHWWREPPGTEPVISESQHWPLPKSILPGEYALAWTRIRAPQQPGLYRVGLDLIQENVCWFGQYVDMPAFAVNVLAREDEDWFPDLPEKLRPLRPYPKQA